MHGAHVITEILFKLKKKLLIELCQYIVVCGFMRRRPSSRYCCYGNHAAGSKLLTHSAGSKPI